MTSGDDTILERLRTDYASDWTISMVRKWWKATRHQQLTDDDLNRGLSQTLICDTAGLLRKALAAEAEIQARHPAYL